jgi:hypothetical protein
MSMLKKLLRGVVLLLAAVGAYAAVRFFFWPRTVIVFEDENWIVLVTQFDSSNRVVVVDRSGVPIPDFPLETDSRSGPVVTKTDAAGRGQFVTYESDAVAWFPTGDTVSLDDVGLTVFVRKSP